METLGLGSGASFVPRVLDWQDLCSEPQDIYLHILPLAPADIIGRDVATFQIHKL